MRRDRDRQRNENLKSSGIFQWMLILLVLGWFVGLVGSRCVVIVCCTKQTVLIYWSCWFVFKGHTIFEGCRQGEIGGKLARVELKVIIHFPHNQFLEFPILYFIFHF